jgi:hypothetical protein
MKALILCILATCTLFCVSEKQSKVLPTQKTAETAVPILTDTISFTAKIQPILVSHCSPCHFTGGKMYEKMPFDKAETIITHNEGVLRRIKDEKENLLIKKFVTQQK